jgi:hypothetical protein
VRNDIRSALESNNNKVSEVAKHLAQKYHLPRQKIYEEALRIGGQKTEDRGRIVEAKGKAHRA